MKLSMLFNEFICIKYIISSQAITKNSQPNYNSYGKLKNRKNTIKDTIIDN